MYVAGYNQAYASWVYISYHGNGITPIFVYALTDTQIRPPLTADVQSAVALCQSKIESHGDSVITTTSSQCGSDGEKQLSGALDPCGRPCSVSGTPNQPVNVRDSKQTYTHHSEELKRTKSYSLSLQTSWYKYPWTSVCTSQYTIFCHVCRSAKHEGLLMFSKRQLNCFVEDGFSNWRNASAKLDEHEG